MPRISKGYVELGAVAGQALNCQIARFTKFDRKHYFYPDLAKGYQITQYDIPLCTNGYVDLPFRSFPKDEQPGGAKCRDKNFIGENCIIETEGNKYRRVRVERIHLEEDVGKSLHLQGAHSYIDYNRCGTPLIEIVTKPDMTSPEEAALFMQTVQENEKRLNQQNYELLRLNKQILRDAEMDFLTQLANRRYIDQAFLRFTPPEGVTGTLGLLLIDVDFFKRINDTYGHQEGDLVLKQVASCISAIIRGGDIAGRYGGDEFIVLLPTADVHAIAAVAKRLQDKIHADDMLTARNVTLSIGCASQTSTQTTYDSKQLLKQADDALYHAKENGRNQFVVYKEE